MNESEAEIAADKAALRVMMLREAAGNLLVSRLVERDDWISQGVFDIAAGNRTNWTPQDWRTLLNDLRASRVKLTDWLDLNT